MLDGLRSKWNEDGHSPRRTDDSIGKETLHIGHCRRKRLTNKQLEKSFVKSKY